MSPPAHPTDRSRTTAALHGPVIPGYELLTEIAAGGMASVYLARRTQRRHATEWVAIKQCHPHLRHDPTFVSMFLDEARLASLIRHPNVVETLDIGNADSLYFVMQYVEGASLADLLARLAATDSKLEVSLLLRIVLDSLAGLSAAHGLLDQDGRALRLVHRDISPQNILIGLDGVAKISDFGIAKAEARATRTRTGQVKGKTGYMSPEQILLEPLDRRSDLYAVGVVMWEALTGRRLFDGDSDAAIINQVLSGNLRPPSVFNPDAEPLDALVLRALAFRAVDRFGSAADFAAALEQTRVRIAGAEAVGLQMARWFAPMLESRLNDASALQGGKRTEFKPEPDAATPIGANAALTQRRLVLAFVKPWQAVLAATGIALLVVWATSNGHVGKQSVAPRASGNNPQANHDFLERRVHVEPDSGATNASPTPASAGTASSQSPNAATARIVQRTPTSRVPTYAKTSDTPLEKPPSPVPSARTLRVSPSEFRPKDL